MDTRGAKDFARLWDQFLPAGVGPGQTKTTFNNEDDDDTFVENLLCARHCDRSFTLFLINLHFGTLGYRRCPRVDFMF